MKDNVNQYLRKTFTDMDKNHSILNADKAISRKKAIIDPGSPHVFTFPKDDIKRDDKLADKVGPSQEKRFLEAPTYDSPGSAARRKRSPTKVKLNNACVLVDDDPTAWCKESLSGASQHTKYSLTASKRSKLSSIVGPLSDARSSYLDGLSKRSR